jgi:hypothetical protein
LGRPERQNSAAFAVNSAMPNDIVVQPIAAVRTASDAVGEARAASVPPLPRQDHAADPSPIPNPTLRLDPALGLVVIEFRDNSGAITTSIPSQRQLEAYQRWDMTRVGPRPVGLQKPAPRAPPPAPAPEPTAKPHEHTRPTKAASGR